MRYGIAILLIAFFAIIGTVVLVGRGNNKSTSTKAARITRLADYENKDSSSVSWTQQGRLVGEDTRKAIRVTVTRNKRTVEVLEGYEERVGKSQDYANTPAAYSAFLRALDNANFGRERTVKQADERGVCPLGNRFIYRATDFSKEIMRTWSDTCLVGDGPFGGGNAAQIIAQLFKAQATDYIKFVNGVQL